MDKIHWASQWLANQNVDDQYIQWFALGIDLVLLALISLVADLVSRKVLVRLIHTAVQRTKATWDDYFFQQKVFTGLAHLIPAGIIYQSLPTVFK